MQTSVCLIATLREMFVLSSSLILKVSEMKKTAPASTGRDKAGASERSSGGDSRETASELNETASSSSSSFSDELQGFTLASELYSVSYFIIHSPYLLSQACGFRVLRKTRFPFPPR